MSQRIGKFQVANLIAQNIPFLFYRTFEDSQGEEVLSRSEYLSSADIQGVLAEKPKDIPVVVVATEETMSSIQQWEQAGFINIYTCLFPFED